MARGTTKSSRDTSPARVASLRAIPSVDECIRAASHSATLAQYSEPQLKRMVGRAISGVRDSLLYDVAAEPRDRDAIVASIIAAAEQDAIFEESRVAPLVNATGVVLHTNLGRAILAEAA